jgi:integrase
MAVGLRLGELLGLTWTDVDGQRSTVTVRRTLQRYGGEFHLDEPKTRRSTRIIPLPAALTSLLAGHRERQQLRSVSTVVRSSVRPSPRVAVNLAVSRAGPLFRKRTPCLQGRHPVRSYKRPGRSPSRWEGAAMIIKVIAGGGGSDT